MRPAGLAVASLLLTLPLHAELSIANPVVARFDGGPSVAQGTAFAAGETVYLSFEIAGYQREGEEDEQKLRVAWRCEVSDAAGIALAAAQAGKVEVDLAPEDKNWRPKIRVALRMPDWVGAGDAALRISATDNVANVETKLAVPFRLAGPKIDSEKGFHTFGFAFYRTAESADPLTIPAYGPGETVFARFQMAGYELGDGNAWNVSYGLEVLRANGEPLFQQLDAAEESGKSAYPRRSVGGVLSLNLTKDLPRGAYTIVLTVRDVTSGMTAESRHVFQVE